MFGRIGDFIDGLNLDVAVMTAGTRAFVAKERASAKIHDTFEDVSDKFKLSDDEDKTEEKTSEIPVEEKKEEVKEEQKEETKEEESKLPGFLTAAMNKVKADKEAKAKKEAEDKDSKKKEAEEAADLFFEGLKSSILAGAETDYEKKSMEAMIDKIKEKSNLKDVITEIALEISEMQEEKEAEVVEGEVVESTTTPTPGVTYDDKNIGLDMSGLVIKDEGPVTTPVEAAEPKVFIRETPKHAVTKQDIENLIHENEREELGMKGKKKK